MSTTNRFWMKGCPACGGDLYITPDMDSNERELKCVQCGRVFASMSNGRWFRVSAVQPLPESQAQAGVRATVAARRTFDQLLSPDEKKRGVAFRLSRKGDEVEVERGVAQPDDVVIQYHRHPVLAVGAETLDVLGGTTIETKDITGQPMIVIRQPRHRGQKLSKPREIAFA